jgi:hypothetical protein
LFTPGGDAISSEVNPEFEIGDTVHLSLLGKALK